MALVVYRFRLRDPGASLAQLNTEIGTTATLSDGAGGSIVDLSCDDTFGQNLIDSVEARGYVLVAGDPVISAEDQYRIDNNIPIIKSGAVLAGSFAGNPREASVLFNTPFPDAAYSESLSCRVTANKAFTPQISGHSNTGFSINMMTNNITGLTLVNWVAVQNLDP